MNGVRFNFDEFVLDTGARELRNCGTPVHLSPKAFELLQLLIERRPDAISKAELHTLLWQNTFVTDTTLATLVSEVRNALGDDARRSRYVRTVHAFGYAFCGLARTAPDSAGVAPAAYWVEWQGKKFPLIGSQNIVGRAAECAIVVDLPEVSRRHALITVSAEGVIIEDLKSRNGTFICGERVTSPSLLHDGCDIAVGPARLTFHVALRDATTRAAVGPENDPKNSR